MSEINAKSLTSEEQQLWDTLALWLVKSGDAQPHNAFSGSADAAERMILARRALFGSPASEPAKVCPNCGLRTASMSRHEINCTGYKPAQPEAVAPFKQYPKCSICGGWPLRSDGTCVDCQPEPVAAPSGEEPEGWLALWQSAIDGLWYACKRLVSSEAVALDAARYEAGEDSPVRAFKFRGVSSPDREALRPVLDALRLGSISTRKASELAKQWAMGETLDDYAPAPNEPMEILTGDEPAQPSPVAAYHAAPMMGFPCANCGQETLRMDGHVSHRASGDETEYYCEKPAQPEPSDTDAEHEAAWREFKGKPEPVAAEIPEAVESALKLLRSFSYPSCSMTADALESFWHTHATQPTKVQTSPELENVLSAAANAAAKDYGRGMNQAGDWMMDSIAAVRAQAAEAGKVRMTPELDRAFREADGFLHGLSELSWNHECKLLDDLVAAVRTQAAEAGKVKLPKVRELIVFAIANAQYLKDSLDEGAQKYVRQMMHDKIDAALAELDTAEGKGEGRG